MEKLFGKLKRKSNGLTIKKPPKCYQRLRGVSEDTNILQTSNKIISYLPWSSQWENTFEKINLK